MYCWLCVDWFLSMYLFIIYRLVPFHICWLCVDWFPSLYLFIIYRLVPFHICWLCVDWFHYFFSMIKNNFLLKYITIWYYYYNVRQFTDLYFLNIVIILTCSQLYKKHKIFLSNIPILKITYTSLNKSKEYDTYFIFLWKLFEIYSD
jgi:hypothetical protein